MLTIVNTGGGGIRGKEMMDTGVELIEELNRGCEGALERGERVWGGKRGRWRKDLLPSISP